MEIKELSALSGTEEAQILNYLKAILKIRPGLSDFASIKYRDEETILASQPDPEHYYRLVILHDKLCLARRYAEEISFSTDLGIIKDTFKSIVIF